MHPLAAIAVKSIGGGTVAALLSVGAVSAASPSPSPSPASSSSANRHAVRAAVVRAVIDSEAQVLGIKPEELAKELRDGKKISTLAQAKGMTKAQFTIRLLADLTPRLEALVHDHRIIQRRADRIIARIASGHVPFWDGAHPRK
jgi:membrane-bound lytic murein transglycosylase B